MHPEASLSDKKLAVFIIDDIIDHVGLELLPEIMNKSILNILFKSCEDDNSNLRQAANFGVGIFIAKCPTLFNN